MLTSSSNHRCKFGTARLQTTLKRRPCLARAGGLPKNWTQVVSWAKQEFLKEVDTGKPDECISLAKACMLLALEEEAALEVHPEIVEVLQSLPELKMPSHAGASTWSLERLDALTAEIKDLIMASLPDWQQADAVASSSGAAAAEAAPLPMPSAAPPPSTSIVAAGVLCDTPAASTASVGNLGATKGFNPDVDANTSKTSALNVGPSFMELPPGLFQTYPNQVVSAINEILYNRHGYTPCNRYGNIRDAQLSRVLEGGMGCSPALSVLYLVVAQKLGIRMAATLSLESGRYIVLWPVDNDGVTPPLLLPEPVTSSTAPSFSAQDCSDPTSGHFSGSPQTSTSPSRPSSSSSNSIPHPPSNVQQGNTPQTSIDIAHQPTFSSSDSPTHISSSGSSLQPPTDCDPNETSASRNQEGSASSTPTNLDPSSPSSSSSSGSAAGLMLPSNSNSDSSQTTDFTGLDHTEASRASKFSQGPSSQHSSGFPDEKSYEGTSSRLDGDGSSSAEEAGVSQQREQLKANRCVIDPYGCGELLEVEEVCELFEVEPEVLLRPASQRQILAALLARQVDAYFAKAAGCNASPASMVPLSIETALDRIGAQMSGGGVGTHALSRALAAAEKRMVLLPGESEPQLKVALLHYYGRSFDDAYLELGAVLERIHNSSSSSNNSFIKDGSIRGGYDSEGSHGNIESSGNGNASATVVLMEKGSLLLEKIRLELMYKENRL